MMNWVLLSVGLLVGGVLPVGAENLDIYLAIGQSNMAGRATIEAEDEAVLERCFLFNAEGDWEPAANPMNRFSTVRKDIKMQRLGPVYTFARAMAEHDPEAKIGLVVNARGGTPIEAWAQGEELYNAAVARALQARDAGGEIRGIIWHQGEGNSRDPEYLHKLAALVAALRTDLEVPDLPFVAGKVEGDRPVNALIAETGEAIENASAVSTSLLGTTDGTHFDSAAQRELGRRYAAEMIRLQEHKDRVGREIPLFDGESFAGWEGPSDRYFRIEDGSIVAGRIGWQVPHNQFLTTTRSFRNFELTLQFKLIGSEGVNSGVQFRSVRAATGAEVSGYQADLGNPGWWGSLYDEQRRNRVLAQSDVAAVNEVLKLGEWNDYKIRAEGSRIRIWINDVQTVDYLEEEPGVDQAGVIGMQIHAMAPGEAWYRDIVVVELP